MAVEMTFKKKLGSFTLDMHLKSSNRRIGILGASGCGKSMTLKSIAGIVTPDEGRIIVDQKVVFDSEKKVNWKPQKRNVGYLFQNYALFPNMTVKANIAAGLKGTKAEQDKRVEEMLGKFQLSGLGERLPGELSGGQQQRAALARIMAYEPDMILLDLGLPDGEGLEVVKHVRELSNTPIIVVSARQEEQEKIQALDAGADDYVTKPFYMGELMARIRVAMRKMEKMAPDSAQEMFHQDYLTVDYTKRSVMVDGEEIHLTPIEYKILTLLISNRGKVLTHNYILKEIWGYGEGVEAGTLRVFMATLRR